jgi:internalin A
LHRYESLDLSRLDLTEVPASARQLEHIEMLVLESNRLRELPSWIGELRNLRLLLLGHNRPGIVLPDVIGELSELSWLSLSDLGLEEVPIWVGALRKLQFLDLSENDLRSLPSFLRRCPLRELSVHGNAELAIPDEVVQTKDPRKILDFASRVRHAASPRLNEFKLILVGRGGVGKTSLVHRLVQNKYKKFGRTPGIKIEKWPMQIDGEEVIAHAWDFGGQEIMHGTHRFFMTERALYLALITGREGTEDHDADYWLSMIRSFAGPDAPIIVLLHKWDDYRFEVNRELLREKHGANLVFLETDSETGKNIEALRETICEHAAKLPGLKAMWPAEWRSIKDELPDEKKSWLSYAAFCDFCAKRGVQKSEDQDALADTLHILGSMLCFRKDEQLRNFGVLNPQWVTRGIYQMLNAATLRDAGGKFSISDFGTVLKRKDYPVDLHPYLLALMRKFRLCHPLDDNNKAHLIPELLTKEEPKLDAEFPPRETLGFVYRYDSVLPEGLLPRFIVETYVLREPKRAWRTGVVLERANCRAWIRGDLQSRRITIRVAGPSGSARRELLGIIREHFERIHATFKQLPVTELVPIPDHPTVEIPYENLLAYERHGDDEYKEVINGVPTKLSVKQLLDGVDIPGRERRELQRIFTPGLDVFISYAHRDSSFLDQLKAALVPYERMNTLRIWADQLIEPGQAWEKEISDHLNRADIVILLVSNDFLKSKYCIEKELARAIDRNCKIIPIIVRGCRFDLDEAISKLQVIHASKPVEKYRPRADAWLKVTEELDRVLANPWPLQKTIE